MTTPAPEFLYPLRLTLHVPDNAPRLSVLDFPYGSEIDRFIERFTAIYKQRYNKDKLDFAHLLSYRQLNDALLALAPGLVQGFEQRFKGDVRRMVTFTRYAEDRALDFPKIDAMHPLIQLWLERWAAQEKIRELITGAASEAWAELKQAMKNAPQERWQHGIDPRQIATQFGQPGNASAISGYLAFPALLVGLLHDQTIHIERGTRSFNLTWRRVNDGGKNGLHLVSQPIEAKSDHYAYRLDFSVQTQAGMKHNHGAFNGWIFARLSIQRYVTGRYKHYDRRHVSVLVGHNQERFSGGWDDDTTLIRLPVGYANGELQYQSGVGGLLDEFAMRPLVKPAELFEAPRQYGVYDTSFDQDDEYYVIYAEGRRFGEGVGRQHKVLTGTRLHERAQIIYQVVDHLDGWLRFSPPLKIDAQRPGKLYSLYTYDKMRKSDKKGAKAASWQTMLGRALSNSDADRVHLIVLQQHDNFMQLAPEEIKGTVLGADEVMTASGDRLLQIDYLNLPPSLYFPLDPGNLDPELLKWENRDRRPPNFYPDWDRQMALSRAEKLRSWEVYLDTLPWAAGSRRLLLIDSTGEANTHETRRIKGIIRAACSTKGISSQFIVGARLETVDKKRDASLAKVRNAALDLIVRQQGVLYGPPKEMYEQAAQLPADVASNLDIIAFCRLRITEPVLIQYAVAIRLRANGEVDVALPGQPQSWMPYPLAAHAVGALFAEERIRLLAAKNKSLRSPLRMQHPDLLAFVRQVLVDARLERPTIAVIDAEGWRNGRDDGEDNPCWTQLRNHDLSQTLHELRLGRQTYQRDAPVLESLMGIVRLRMGAETPQYVTTEPNESSTKAVNVPHLTGYTDTQSSPVFHYFSVGGLPEMQKNQPVSATRATFKHDVIPNRFHDVAIKHPQLIEMVPFFVHSSLDSDAGKRAICRAIHFLRVSPSFTMGDIVSPYPMHLGEKLIRDQLVIIDSEL